MIPNAGIKNSSGFTGDFFMVINIHIPKKVSTKETELLEKLSKSQTKNENNVFFDSLTKIWQSLKNRN